MMRMFVFMLFISWLTTSTYATVQINAGQCWWSNNEIIACFQNANGDEMGGDSFFMHEKINYVNGSTKENIYPVPIWHNYFFNRTNNSIEELKKSKIATIDYSLEFNNKINPSCHLLITPDLPATSLIIVHAIYAPNNNEVECNKVT